MSASVSPCRRLINPDSGELKEDPTHFSKIMEGTPIPLMYTGTSNDGILKQRVVTNNDISGLRNQNGFNFQISPKKFSSTLVIEYSDPNGPHPYLNGEKTKK